LPIILSVVVFAFAGAILAFGGASFANASSNEALAANQRLDDLSIIRMAQRQRLDPGAPFRPSPITTCPARQCVNGSMTRCSRRTVVMNGKASSHCTCRTSRSHCRI
jgi:hypothetical protein